MWCTTASIHGTLIWVSWVSKTLVGRERPKAQKALINVLAYYHSPTIWVESSPTRPTFIVHQSKKILYVLRHFPCTYLISISRSFKHFFSLNFSMEQTNVQGQKKERYGKQKMRYFNKISWRRKNKKTINCLVKSVMHV